MNKVIENLPFPIKLLIAATVQGAILLLLIIIFGLNISSGQKVYLRVEPVDPIDPLRGRYVTVQYQELSRLAVYNYSSASQEFRVGDQVYVMLNNYGDYWSKSYSFDQAVTKTKPSQGTFIRGTVTSVVQSDDVYSEPTQLTISYGIEQYFIPETADGNLPFDRDIIAEVYIDSNGKAALRRLFVDGTQWP